MQEKTGNISDLSYYISFVLAIIRLISFYTITFNEVCMNVINKQLRNIRNKDN